MSNFSKSKPFGSGVTIMDDSSPVPMALIQCQSFGEDFVWGSGTSSYQFEGAADKGGRGPSIWDTFTHKWPGKMEDGSNGTTAVDFYNKYKEDVKIAKDIGFNAFRISISWSRILPTGKISGGRNEEGIKFYSDLIDELLSKGVTPFVTLFHWDLPQALESEYKGFLSTQIVPDFCDYAALCFWEFGDRVKNWITLNEPWSYSTGGYVNGGLAPGRGGPSATPLTYSSSVLPRNSLPENLFIGIRTHRYHIKEDEIPNEALRTQQQFDTTDESSDHGDPGTEPYIVAHNLLLAHAAVVQLYRDNFQIAQKGKIGIILNSNWFEPLDPKAKDDLKAADRAKDFMFGWFMDPLINGNYPQSMQDRVTNRLPGFEDYPYEVQGSYDFIGINYYTAQYIFNLPKPTSDKKYSYDTDKEVGSTYYRGKDPIGPQSGSKWLYIYPKGIGELLKWTAKKYAQKKDGCSYQNDLEIYITENGVCELYDIKMTVKDARVDQMRTDYHSDHLIYLNDAIHDKELTDRAISIKGYFAWSLLDNFEWPSGYTIRFGLVYVDYKDGYFARYPKDSATWFMNFLKSNVAKTVKKNAKKALPPKFGY